VTTHLRACIVALSATLIPLGCSPTSPPAEARPVRIPEPVVNHTAADAKPGQRIEHV